MAQRHGLRIERNRPEPLDAVLHDDDVIVAVCDNAHEELGHTLPRLHWSIPDPVPVDTDAAFEHAYTDINRRVHHLADLSGDTKEAL